MSNSPNSRTLPRLMRELETLYGDLEAVVGRGERLTYRDLLEQVETFAARLTVIGVKPGDKVGVLMGNRPEWIVSALAIASLGCVVVSLNSWATTRELSYLLVNSETQYLVATRSYLRRDYAAALNEMDPEVRSQLKAVIGVDEDLPEAWLPFIDSKSKPDAAAIEAVRAAGDAVDEKAIAFQLYTSGSTSAPKGVQLSHEHLIVNGWHIGERQGVIAGDRLWLAVSLFWALGCVNSMMNLLTHGGCIVLQESFDAAEALRLIEQERCTVFYGTPNIAQALFDHPDRERRDTRSLIKGGTLGSPEQIQRVIEFGVTQVCNIYGLTETYGNSHVTSYKDEENLRVMSCGQPLPGVEQRIVGADGRDLPSGEIGEIRVKGRVCDGYYKNEELSKASFDEQGFFRTGDLGFVDINGYLFYRGRLKELIKSGGINVSPADVEAVLSSHPSVYLAYVVGVPDAVKDEEIGAIVVLKDGTTVTHDDLVQYCKQNLAAYKVPRKLRFVSESELPTTTTGKVQKNRLASTFFTEGADIS
ncbi:class I adenylate-forming enzyme family protein [Paraburkholderia sp. BCC1886]|uniref:class I adenylate-forming enzyme family protein n=1 Tax=Paraburkholderia sp. BCC1886 TaxID=2562670 RepID=UPI001183FBF4|nr:class I adenylate-forming enzyme family protein [Paraburkholderia sp. BCC1886]